MNSQQNFHLSMKKNNDELYTPPLLIEPILHYIQPDTIVWCPFDTENSEFVIMLKENGIKVIHSHIWEGKDFFHYEPSERYDCIISNPPFSKKLKVLKRLYDLDKPFAMILGLPILNYQIIGNFFYNKNSDIQMLIFDKKVSYDGKTPSFNTSYFCRKFLNQQIEFFHLPHNNTGANYRGSRMYADKNLKAQSFWD